MISAMPTKWTMANVSPGKRILINSGVQTPVWLSEHAQPWSGEEHETTNDPARAVEPEDDVETFLSNTEKVRLRM